MKSGKLAKWLKREGDRVETGEILAEVETDKATMEVEAAESGVLERILAPEGAENIAVNSPIAVLAPGEFSASSPLAPGTQAGRDPPAVEEEFVLRITVREALREALAEEMRRDANVFVLGEEVGDSQGAFRITQGLLQEFGARRVVDSPISEHAFAGLGVGAAMAGLRPVIEFMSFNFALQAMDQIVNSAAKTLYMSGGALNIPIVFRGPNGSRARVGAQHAQDFSAWFAHIPGLKVVAPYTAADAKGLLKAAIRDPNPVIFLEHEKLYGQSFPAPRDKDHLVEIGAAGHHLHRFFPWRRPRAESRRTAERGGDRGRSDRPAHSASAGYENDLRFGRQDRALRHRRGRLATGRDWRGDFRAPDGRGLRRSRRAGGAGDGQGRSHALCRQS
jgi:pyruvate dehydrogenase E1 component beta subunit